MSIDGLGKVSEPGVGSGISFGFAYGYPFASSRWVIGSGMCVCLFVRGFDMCGNIEFVRLVGINMYISV